MKPGKKKPGEGRVMVRAWDHVAWLSGFWRNWAEEVEVMFSFSMKAMTPLESTPMAALGQISMVVRDVECTKAPM
jgi:hypothetical protein